MADGASERALADDLVQAFVRLAKGDFTVRLPRNFKRDTDDTLAFFVNLIAEELARLTRNREENLRELEQLVTTLSELFLRLAAGDFSVRAERTETGDPIDVLAFMFNNTAAEVGEAVAEVEHQRIVVEAILDSMVDGMLLLEPDGSVRRCNSAMARLLGRSRQELAETSLVDLVDVRECEFARTVGQQVQERTIRNRDTLFLTASGETLSMAVNGSPYRSAEGQLEGIVLLVRDDRELKQAQAQLQLSDRLATMGTVAAGVAHEINNPLAFVISNLDFIAEELDDFVDEGELSKDRIEEMRRAIEASQGGADRVRQIVRDLKSFSRAEEDDAHDVDLNKMVEAAASFIRSEARHHARVVKEYGVVPPVRASEGRLVQVFLNMLQNAAQAIPLGRADANEIGIKTWTNSAGEAVVEIRDTGAGISEADQQHIFDLFFTTKPVGVGTGLGLSIVHRIVGELRGRIEVDSKLGEGSTFRVVLPASTNGASDGAVDAPHSIRAEARRLRVLVVDDEQEIGQAVLRTLGRDHDVDVVTRGTTALALLEATDYDLVLCDLLMPEMTGIELFDVICERLPDKAKRFVFMTGGSSHPDARKFLARVSNPRLEKPFDARTLRSVIAPPAEG